MIKTGSIESPLNAHDLIGILMSSEVTKESKVYISDGIGNVLDLVEIEVFEDTIFLRTIRSLGYSRNSDNANPKN